MKYGIVILFHKNVDIIIHAYLYLTSNMLVKEADGFGFANPTLGKIIVSKQRFPNHYDDVTMNLMATQITSLTIVYSTVYSGADQRKHQSSASLAFVWGIHRGPVNSPHKWPVTRKMFPFDDVIMMASDWLIHQFTKSGATIWLFTSSDLKQHWTSHDGYLHPLLESLLTIVAWNISFCYIIVHGSII